MAPPPQNARVKRALRRRAARQERASEVKQDVKRIVKAEVKKKSLLRQGLEGAAGLAGGYFGFGKQAKRLASSGLDYIGVGSYRFSDGTVQGTPPPTRIRKIEFVKNIVGSVNFVNNTYLINPTNEAVFPWLSQIANSYQRFKFNSLVFHFKTTCGSAVSSTNNALGVFGMVFNYDPDAAPFVDKVAAEATGKCMTTVPSKSRFCGMECKKSMATYPWYFTFVPTTTTKENKLLYPAKVNFFTQGMQVDNITLGEMWVEYDVTLMDTIKQLPGESAQSDAYNLGGSSGTGPGAATKIAGNLGTNVAAGGILSFPASMAPGLYQLTWFAQYGSGSAVNPAFSAATSNIVASNSGPLAGQALCPENGVVSLNHSVTYVIAKTNNSVGSITLGYSAAVTVVSSWLSVAALYSPPSLLYDIETKKLMDLLTARMYRQYADGLGTQSDTSSSLIESLLDKDEIEMIPIG